MKAEEVLRHEKHSWLLNHILYLEVQELLLDYELKSQDVSLSSRDQQVSTSFIQNIICLGLHIL
jgi:hypothetical protein